MDYEKLKKDAEKLEKQLGKFSMGTTAFLCKNCKTVTVVENLDLEVMREFRCPGCNMSMTSPGFARLKMQYYFYLQKTLSTPPFPKVAPELFEVRMDFNPHFRPNQAEPDRRDQGGSRLIPIDDHTFDTLEWDAVDGAELHNIITGQTITGAEPIDYPDTDGILISLKDPDTGTARILEILYDSLSADFYIHIARVPDSKGRSGRNGTQESKR